MSMTLKPGSRLFSVACTTEVIVVKAPSGPIELTIGGAEPVASPDARPSERSVVAGHDGGSAMGKRYVDDTGEIELLCTKAGEGGLALGGVAMSVKDAKPLPSSD